MAKKKTPKKKAAQKSVAKKATAKRAARIPNLATMRGVPSFDLEEMAILVRANCTQVAEAFKKRNKLKTWIRNAAGKTVTISEPCFLVYQLKGHPWVIINGLFGNYVPFEDAKALSKTLATRVIYFGNSDASCVTQYDLYENGKQLEHFDIFEGVKFSSQFRNVKPPKDCPDVYAFVDEFFKEQDAFIPGWSALLFDDLRCNEGDEVKLDFGAALNGEILAGFDYVSL